MNRALAQNVADAVLYEGYMLYPYRRSAIKNRQRWSFGILYPPAYEEVRTGTERAHMHSELIIVMRDTTRVDVQLRFLQLTTCRSSSPDDRWNEGTTRSLDYQITVPLSSPFGMSFHVPASSSEPEDAGRIERTQHEITGALSIFSEQIDSGVYKATVHVSNDTRCGAVTRDDALLRSMLSAHLILTVENGGFVSLLDPPEQYSQTVKSCNNIGNFPVLIGNEGEHDMMLCSPILLYDYPQVAPESAGDFFDATEMDEMLTLRVMTLTDAEKNEVRSGDSHARALLERTEQTVREQLQRTHGIIRCFRAAGADHE